MASGETERVLAELDEAESDLHALDSDDYEAQRTQRITVESRRASLPPADRSRAQVAGIATAVTAIGAALAALVRAVIENWDTIAAAFS